MNNKLLRPAIIKRASSLALGAAKPGLALLVASGDGGAAGLGVV